MQKPTPSLPSRYIYQQDPRTQTEKHLTIKITRILSEINLKRVKKQQNKNLAHKINKDLFYFICLCGVPPMNQQFQKLDLPGEKIILSVYGFGGYSTEKYLEKFKQANFKNYAQYLRSIVERECERRKVVFVYHSFGSYLSYVYFHLYQQNPKISGIIDIGGAPIRFYAALKTTTSGILGTSNQQLLQNRTAIFQQYQESFRADGIRPISNEFETIIFLKYILLPEFQTMFEYSRKLPDILKLIIYGTEDILFTENLLAEKSIYYSQLKFLPADLDSQLKKTYEKCFGEQCKNIQEKFCVGIPGGKHSLHVQKKCVNDVKLLISNYLYLLQQSTLP